LLFAIKPFFIIISYDIVLITIHPDLKRRCISIILSVSNDISSIHFFNIFLIFYFFGKIPFFWKKDITLSALQIKIGSWFGRREGRFDYIHNGFLTVGSFWLIDTNCKVLGIRDTGISIPESNVVRKRIFPKINSSSTFLSNTTFKRAFFLSLPLKMFPSWKQISRIRMILSFSRRTI